jgi:hypothetical protein
MQTDDSDEQPENTDISIREIGESDTNATVNSELHSEKHASPRLSTDERIEIDASDAQEPNAEFSRRAIFEPDSNVTFERE